MRIDLAMRMMQIGRHVLRAFKNLRHSPSSNVFRKQFNRIIKRDGLALGVNTRLGSLGHSIIISVAVNRSSKTNWTSSLNHPQMLTEIYRSHEGSSSDHLHTDQHTSEMTDNALAWGLTIIIEFKDHNPTNCNNAD